MRLLICTCLPAFGTSPGRNRLDRMARALEPFGIDSVFIGRGEQVGSAWAQADDAGRRRIVYDGSRTGAKRLRRAMTIGAQAARFYRDHLPELSRRYECDGIIAYLQQARLGGALLDVARSTRTWIVADMVERYRPSMYYLLSGVYTQQIRLCGSVLPKYDGIIGISKAWCDWAESRGVPSVWIPSLAEDHGAVRSEPSPPGRPFTLVFIGHWVERELPLTFLRAMRICIDRGIDVRMNVLGKVRENRRARKAVRFVETDPMLREHVHFLGFVSDAKRDAELAEADAFVLLRSDCRETDMLFPTRLPEYMLTANPVILSQVGSFPYCFEHRRDVWFVSAENRPEEVAEAIAHLHANPDERLAIGRAGRDTALAQFSPQVLGERLAGFLHERVGQ